MRKSARKSKSRTKRKLEADPNKTLVKIANRLKDPLQELCCESKYTENNLNLSIVSMPSSHLDETTIQWAFQLTKTNMKTLYETCEWGWDDDDKLSQLKHRTARFLIVKDENNHPKAFVHFRFDMDFGDPVVYCYEIQIETDIQRKGVGKHLINLLCKIGAMTEMKKVVLTVLKHNKLAYNFYTRICGFKIDASSPDKTEEACYEILSKECEFGCSVTKRFPKNAI
ncbi:N-alpha-acetyltransferase 40-like [Centruroides sculpturatus]|uniref:N-alpha-acetyltransferase 40-like n=1 Tax=Centruroides sculpturatus TaxID=218467 RepID=UPI000C6D8E69|nr:N-alpha-acetyltransferase 40-like [Centruroides sculpturatus]